LDADQPPQDLADLLNLLAIARPISLAHELLGALEVLVSLADQLEVGGRDSGRLGNGGLRREAVPWRGKGMLV